MVRSLPIGSDDNPAFKLLYNVNDRPPFGRLLLYGLQWLVIFLPTLTMASILAAEVLGLETGAREAFFQRLCLVTGATVVLQTLAGHQLPLIDGPAMALILTLASLASVGQAAINGGLIFGGLLLVLFGAMNWLRYLTTLFTDRVIGVILLLIGLSMLPYLMPMMLGIDDLHPAGRPVIYVSSLGVLLGMVLMIYHFKGIFQSLAIVIGVILGTLFFGLMGWVDLSRVGRAAWVSAPHPLGGPPPQANLSAIVSFLLAYLAVTVNSLGSVFSVKPLLGLKDINRRLSRGLIFTGLSGILSGAAGVVGTVPYSNSPGIITVTRVGTRFALTVCGVVLCALAFLGKLTAVFTAIPNAVVGAALLSAVAAQVGVGVDAIRRQGGSMTGRDYLVIGLPVMLGVIASILPMEFLEQLPEMVRPLVGNGLIVGMVSVLALEHGILREKETRQES